MNFYSCLNHTPRQNCLPLHPARTPPTQSLAVMNLPQLLAGPIPTENVVKTLQLREAEEWKSGARSLTFSNQSFPFAILAIWILLYETRCDLARSGWEFTVGLRT